MGYPKPKPVRTQHPLPEVNPGSQWGTPGGGLTEFERLMLTPEMRGLLTRQPGHYGSKPTYAPTPFRRGVDKYRPFGRKGAARIPFPKSPFGSPNPFTILETGIAIAGMMQPMPNRPRFAIEGYEICSGPFPPYSTWDGTFELQVASGDCNATQLTSQAYSRNYPLNFSQGVYTVQSNFAQTQQLFIAMPYGSRAAEHSSYNKVGVVTGRISKTLAAGHSALKEVLASVSPTARPNVTTLSVTGKSPFVQTRTTGWPESSTRGEPKTPSRTHTGNWAKHAVSLVTTVARGRQLQPARPEPGGHTPSRPDKGTKERKARKTKAFGMVWEAIGDATEALDALGCMEKSLPKRVRRQLFVKRGYRAPTPYEKAQEIYDHAEDMDMEALAGCLATQQIEDRVYAAMSPKGSLRGDAPSFETGMWDSITKDLDIKIDTKDNPFGQLWKYFGIKTEAP